MTNQDKEQDLQSELNQLADNLKLVGQRAWHSPERRQLQSELERTIREIEVRFQRAGREFQQSEAGQRLSRDLQRIKDEFESGEIQRQAQSELTGLINQLNQKLESWLRPDGGDAERSDSDDEGPAT